MHRTRTIALIVAMLLLSAAGAAEDADLLQFEGRWTPRGERHGFLGEVPAMDLARCGDEDGRLCGREISADGACGRLMLRLDISDGVAKGFYQVDLYPDGPDRELDQFPEDSLMAVRAYSKGDTLSMRTSPSEFYRMLARTRLDDITVVFERAGRPACAATS